MYTSAESDLKPSDCFVSAKTRIQSNSSWAWETYYVVKLSSFDQLKLLYSDESTCHERRVGTIRFMSRELHVEKEK